MSAMSPVTSPSSDREAAIEAKIAKIRAQNEALLRRHQEVEEDRRSAEKRNSALQPKQVAKDWEEEGAFQNPFHPERAQPRGARNRDGERRRFEGAGGGRRGGGGRGDVKQRLGEKKDGREEHPNRFLADSSREEDRFGQGRGRGRGGGAFRQEERQRPGGGRRRDDDRGANNEK